MIIKTLEINNELNDDWMKKLPGYKNEVAIHQLLARKAQRQASLGAIIKQMTGYIKPSESNGIMIGFMIPEGIINPDIEYPPKSKVTLPTDYHLTLKYLGDVMDMNADTMRNLVHLLQHTAKTWEAMKLDLPGTIGVFSKEESDVWYLEVANSSRLELFRKHLCDSLYEAGIYHDPQEEFNPHVTLAYVPNGSPKPTMVLPSAFINLPKLSLVIGEWVISWEFTGGL